MRRRQNQLSILVRKSRLSFFGGLGPMVLQYFVQISTINVANIYMQTCTELLSRIRISKLLGMDWGAIFAPCLCVCKRIGEPSKHIPSLFPSSFPRKDICYKFNFEVIVQVGADDRGLCGQLIRVFLANDMEFMHQFRYVFYTWHGSYAPTFSAGICPFVWQVTWKL